MRFLKITVVSFVLLSLIVLVGFRIKDVNSTNLSNKKGGGPKKVPITVISPKMGYFSKTLTVSGTILSTDEVEITPRANGKLLSLLVEEGATVSKGQLIGTIDHSELDNQLAQAQARVRIANANLNMSINGPLKPQIKQSEAIVSQQEASLSELEASKTNIETDLNGYQRLFEKGLISQQQLNNSKTQLEVVKQQIKAASQQIESSRQALNLLNGGTRPEEIEVNRGGVDNALAEVNLYKSQLSNYNIISPMTGVVTRKFLSSGSLVSQTTPVITISKTSNPEILMNIPENEIENIKIGQNLEVKTSSNSTKSYKGKIKSIYPSIDTQTRLGKVKATLTSSHNLKIGMILVCNIYTIEKNKTLTLPSDAIIKDNKATFVYTVVNNKSVKKDVVIGIEEPDTTEIISGLKNTEKVILKGNTFVKSGTVVEIKPEFKAKS